MPPRPILKGLPSSNLSFVSSEPASNPLPFSSCSTIFDSPHVHFPPTPTLTSTAITHSSFIYDRAPIVVTPNTCALPERGDRKFIGNSNKGGLGYFHPHAKFQVDSVRVERDSESETASPTIFSASVTVGNVNDCGSLGLFMKKRSGPLYDYDYDYDQHPSHDHDQHTQHVIPPLIFDYSSESSDLGVFCSPPTQYVQTPSLSSTCSSSPSSIPCSSSSVNLSTWNVYNNTSTVPPSPSSTANNNMAGDFDNTDSYPNQFISHTHIGIHDGSGYPSTSKQSDHSLFLPSSSSVSISGSPMKARDKHQDKKKSSVDADGKRKRKSREHTRTETQWTMSRPKDSDTDTSHEFELEGCLGGF